MRSVVKPEVFEALAVGDLVYVHDPVPPAYTLILGQVEQKDVTPKVAAVYLPALGRTVLSEPDRLHTYPLDQSGGEAEGEPPSCPYCRVPAVTGAARPPPPEPPSAG